MQNSSKPPTSSTCAAPKLPPSKKQGDKNTVSLVSNVYEITANPKMIYQYEVEISLESAKKAKRNVKKEVSQVNNRQFNFQLLRYLMEKFVLLPNGEVVAYDCRNLLFSSTNLDVHLQKHNFRIGLRIDTLPLNVTDLLNDKRMDFIAIKFQSSKSFDFADGINSNKNSNLSVCDATARQFLNILTSQDPLERGFLLFGHGKIVNPKAERIPFSRSMEIVHGADKSIKCIEGKPKDKSVVPSLIVDSKVCVFFKSQSLVKTVEEINQRIMPKATKIFFFDRNGGRNRIWCEVNKYIKGLRLQLIGQTPRCNFFASGISTESIDKLVEKIGNKEVAVMDKLRPISKTRGIYFNKFYPAVCIQNRSSTVYYPFEHLMICPNQRVPFEKIDKPPRAEPPSKRFERINLLLQELNLDSTVRRNRFLNAFNIQLSSKPILVDALIRNFPTIKYQGKTSVNAESWSGRSDKFVVPAEVDQIIVAYASDEPTVRVAAKCILQASKEKGIIIKDTQFVAVSPNFEGLKEAFKNASAAVEKKHNRKKVLFMYFDHRNLDTHGILKLLERRYNLIAQHVTIETAKKLANATNTLTNIVSKLNAKLGGLNYYVLPDKDGANVWLNDRKTLVIGYDVGHPSKAGLSRSDPTSSFCSVVGFAFNGTKHPESFIGDYHFQDHCKEEVDAEIIIDRSKWMLEIFVANRGLPENVVIIRDGVSEGQYSMVLSKELKAWRLGISEFGNTHSHRDWKPKFLVAIVTKRHNLRFARKTNSGFENPPPCIVVDEVVTRANLTECYIQAHKPVQGTAKGPLCQLMVNELDFTMDEFQSFLIALSFNHQICEKSISLPEPVYQADEWCSRGKTIWETFLRFNKEEKWVGEECTNSYEKMTNLLAWWKSPLCLNRINA